MTDILGLVFRTFASQTDVKQQLAAGPPPPAAGSSALLVGPSGTSRSGTNPSGTSRSGTNPSGTSPSEISRSVLLLAAVAAASEAGVRVVFFSRTQIQSLPVCLQQSFLSADRLKKIKFSYPRTLEELLQQVASLHESSNTSPSPPSLIIVDRLDGYLCGAAGGGHGGFQPGEQSCTAHLSALLCDSAAFLTRLLRQRCSSSPACRVIASFHSEKDMLQAGAETSSTDPILDVLDRYFPVRCTLDRDRSYEAAAAGLQEVWHVYFSGTGITDAYRAKDCEDRTLTPDPDPDPDPNPSFNPNPDPDPDPDPDPAAAREWQLLISTDGSMEFKMV